MQPLHKKRRQRQEFPPPLPAFLMSIEIGGKGRFHGTYPSGRPGRRKENSLPPALTAPAIHSRPSEKGPLSIGIQNPGMKPRLSPQRTFPFGPCLNLYRSLIGRTKDGYVTGWDTGAGASSFLRSHAGIGFSSGLEQWTTFISTSNSTAKTSFRLVLFSFYALLEQSVPLPCAAPVGRYKRARRHVPPSSL